MVLTLHIYSIIQIVLITTLEYKFDVMLVLSAGTEALFADVGHFTVRSIQISMCSVTYPALILAYAGQASFLRKNNDLVGETFYKSIPGNSKFKSCPYKPYT